jgi:hypothetical protein
LFLNSISQFSKIQKLALFTLLATTLSPLELTFFNLMLALLVILYFLLITLFFQLDDPLKNENKCFLDFYFFMDFQLNFLTQYQKPQVCIIQKF